MNRNSIKRIKKNRVRRRFYQFKSNKMKEMMMIQKTKITKTRKKKSKIMKVMMKQKTIMDNRDSSNVTKTKNRKITNKN